MYEVCFCVSTAINHECTKNRGITVAEYAFIRNGLNLLYSAFQLCYRRIGPLEGYTPDLLPALLTRLIVGNLCYLALTAVYMYLPLGIGATIIATNPFAITILAHFFLHEKAQFFEIAALIITFTGIAVMGMAHPIDAADEKQHFVYTLGISLAVFVALCLAISTIVSRKLKAIDTSALLFTHMLFGVALAGCILYADKKATPYFVYDSYETYALLLIAGVANIFAMQMWQYSVQYCRSTDVALLKNVSVFYNFMTDLAVFDEKFTLLQLVGAAIVAVTNLLTIYIKARQERLKTHLAYQGMKDEAKKEIELAD